MTLERLFAPQSVAVVGATDRAGTYARVTLENLRKAGFVGAVTGVHPTRTEVLGYRCVPALTDLDAAVDAVVIATPALTVADYVTQARALGCGGAVVYAAGFAESGEREAQDELVRAAGDFPVIGPNGNGLVSVPARAALWGDAVTVPNEPGPIALVTQSGNVGVIALAHRRGLGLHTVVSVGNSAVVDAADALTQLAATEGVRAVALYLEGDGDGVRFARALAACAENDVRVAVLKAGRSPEGQIAGAAHTAALAGDQRVFAALLAESGGVLVREPAELIEAARALSLGRRDPRGAAFLTCSGGDATMAADIAHDAGVSLTALAPTTIAALRELLPPTATAVNPLDHTNLVWADTEAVAAITETVARDAEVGHLIYVQDEPPGMPQSAIDEWRATRAGGLLGGDRAGTTTLVACTTPGQEPEGAVSGLGPLMTALAALQRPAPDPVRLRSIADVAASLSTENLPHSAVSDASMTTPADFDGKSLAEHQAKRLLGDAGIAVPPAMTASTSHEAALAAEQLGFPVALKLSAPGLMHKSDIGAIEVGLRDVAAVVAAAERILAITPFPADAVLLVEAMADSGVEVLVSAVRNGVVPALVVGLGGVWAEALDDVVVIPLPAEPADVAAAVRRLRLAAQLVGGRGRPPMAVDALSFLAAAAGRLLVDRDVSLVELNPVIVSEFAAVAVDAVII